VLTSEEIYEIAGMKDPMNEEKDDEKSNGEVSTKKENKAKETEGVKEEKQDWSILFFYC